MAVPKQDWKPPVDPSFPDPSYSGETYTPPDTFEEPEPEITWRRSEKIGDLVAALTRARKKFRKVVKRSANPYYGSKYADLEELTDATLIDLADEGINVFQMPSTVGRSVKVITLMAHTSEQWIEATLTLPGVSKSSKREREETGERERFDPQTIGIAMTYARRYSYQAIVMLAAEQEDDANALSGHVKEPQGKSAKKEPAPKKAEAPPSNAVKFWTAAKRSGKSEEEIRRYLGSNGYEQSAELNRLSDERFKPFMDWAEGLNLD